MKSETFHCKPVSIQDEMGHNVLQYNSNGADGRAYDDVSATFIYNILYKL